MFLASQRISACADISVAVVWFAAERWSLMDAGNLRRNNAWKRESGAVVAEVWVIQESLGHLPLCHAIGS